MEEEIKELDETGSELVKTSRTEPWTEDDFNTEFQKVGLIQEENRWVSRRTVQTGKMVVNGQERVMTETVETSFEFTPDFTATVDDSYLGGINVSVSRNGSRLLSETIYCEPSQFAGFYRFYMGGMQ